MQEMTLQKDITRWPILKSDWLYFFSQRWKGSIQSAKTRPGADYGSDDICTCFTDYMKAFDYVDHNKLWEVFKRWEHQTTWSVFWETCMQDKQQQLELDMEQWTGSKLGKEYIKAVYCPWYLIYVQSKSWEMLDWMSTCWNQDCQEKYQQLQICWWYHFNNRKGRRTKEPLDKGERGEWKSWLKTQHSKY